MRETKQHEPVSDATSKDITAIDEKHVSTTTAVLAQSSTADNVPNHQVSSSRSTAASAKMNISIDLEATPRAIQYSQDVLGGVNQNELPLSQWTSREEPVDLQ